MRRLILGSALAVCLAGCGGSSSSSRSTTTAPAPPVHLASSLRLSSSAFAADGPIPPRHTCDGGDVPVPLRWSGVPHGTRELLLAMRDPDAPGGNFVHWAVAGIPPTAVDVPPTGVVEGHNSFGSSGYRGPCPPRGDKPHHYVITLSALAGPSGLGPGFSADAPVKSAQLAIATLVGTYARR